jgi:hypothetical protein
MAAYATVTVIHDAIANDDALHGHMLPRAAAGTFVVDTHSALGKRISHVHVLDQWAVRNEPARRLITSIAI